MDKAVFVQNIKDYCKRKGVKPTVACRESGVSASFINNIEAKGQVPSVEKVQMLAAYLGVTTSELLGEEKEPAPEDGDGLNEEQQELVSLYKTAPSVLRHATLEMLRSAVIQGKGVSTGQVNVQVKGVSGDPLNAEIKVVRNAQAKRLPMGKVAVRSKRRAKPQGKAWGGGEN